MVHVFYIFYMNDIIIIFAYINSVDGDFWITIIREENHNHTHKHMILSGSPIIRLHPLWSFCVFYFCFSMEVYILLN